MRLWWVLHLIARKIKDGEACSWSWSLLTGMLSSVLLSQALHSTLTSFDIITSTVDAILLEVMITMHHSLTSPTPSSPWMKLFLHHHPIGTIIDRIPSPRRRRSAIHAGRSINSIVRKITMISSASLRIKSSTRILQYPFKVGINHESEDLRNSIIVNSRSHNRQQQNIVAIRWYWIASIKTLHR